MTDKYEIPANLSLIPQIPIFAGLKNRKLDA